MTDLILSMKNGSTYVNIDTPYHENGEIRGQIIVLQITLITAVQLTLSEKCVE